MSYSSRSYGLKPARLLCPWNSSGKNTGVNCHALLLWIFQTQGSNPSLLCLMHWQAGSLPLVPWHQILRVTYLSTSMSKIQMSGGVLHVLLEQSGENMRWKIKEAPNCSAISSNCEIVVKNLGYIGYTKVWIFILNSGLLMGGFPCSSVGKESACIAGDLSLSPGLGSSPGEGHGKGCCQWGGMDPLLECDGACHSPKKPNTIKPQLSRSQITRMINKTELLEERWWTQENMSVLELLFLFFLRQVTST